MLGVGLEGDGLVRFPARRSTRATARLTTEASALVRSPSAGSWIGRGSMQAADGGDHDARGRRRMSGPSKPLEKYSALVWP